MTELTSGIMDGITVVLVAFAAVSLLVSLIMICIITYISVLERTKEIGVLRALGARKKDITRVFDAETCILGVFSGLLGILTAWIATYPINAVLYNLTELEGVAVLQPAHALLLVAISTVLTVLGGISRHHRLPQGRGRSAPRRIDQNQKTGAAEFYFGGACFWS
jgi:putative ABC transport system permease protein